MSLLLLQLLMAHLAGDFLLQPTKWVKHKAKHKAKSKYLYFHIAVHAAFLVICTGFRFEMWWVWLGIICSHFLIDWAKLAWQTKRNQVWLFAFDQLAHIAIIVALAHFWEGASFSFQALPLPYLLLIGVCLLGLTVVAGTVIRIVISSWNQEEKMGGHSLKNAGKYIGMLERLFVFGFVVTNHWEGIGFLLAAKSIFRFGDLSRSKDRKLTEYILIGTLLSFGIAILIAVGFNYLKQML